MHVFLVQLICLLSAANEFLFAIRFVRHDRGRKAGHFTISKIAVCPTCATKMCLMQTRPLLLISLHRHCVYLDASSQSYKMRRLLRIPREPSFSLFHLDMRNAATLETFGQCPAQTDSPHHSSRSKARGKNV